MFGTTNDCKYPKQSVMNWAENLKFEDHKLLQNYSNKTFVRHKNEHRD